MALSSHASASGEILMMDRGLGGASSRCITNTSTGLAEEKGSRPVSN